MNTEEKKESKQRKNSKKQTNKDNSIVNKLTFISKYNLDLSLMDTAVDKAIESGYITKEEFNNGETVINISVVKIGTALDPIEDKKESLLIKILKFLKFFSKRK